MVFKQQSAKAKISFLSRTWQNGNTFSLQMSQEKLINTHDFDRYHSVLRLKVWCQAEYMFASMMSSAMSVF